MQRLLRWKPTDAHKFFHRLLRKEQSLQNTPPYADNDFTLPQITDVQQSFETLNASRKSISV